jgi:hypothetical protein
LHVYSRLAEFALNFLRPSLSDPFLTKDLHLQPLTEASLMDESHATCAFAGRYEFVPGGRVGAEADAAFLGPTWSEVGKGEGEGVLGPV